MATNRFHKAARDGRLEVLKEATRKDTNAKDNEKMTPVMWAAFEGRLDALRLLCGRGGDPDKCDQFGNTALHLAAAKGHLHCVDFLIKFGVNIYALDIDKHSAKDLAAINNKDDILRYLDVAAAKFEAHDKKKAKAMKELAEKNCEKRMREYMKQQQQNQTSDEQHLNDVQTMSSSTSSTKPSNMLSTLKQKIWSSQGNLHKHTKEQHKAVYSGSTGATKFSDFVGAGISVGGAGGSSSSGGSTIASRAGRSADQQTTLTDDSTFKIGEIEANGKRTITSLTGLQRDSEVLYVGTFSSTEDGGKRGKISDVFAVSEECSVSGAYGALARSFSQPDILADKQQNDESSETLMLHRANGLFDRPTMLGSIAFRRSVTAALSQLQPESDIYACDSISSTTTMRNGNSSSSNNNTGNRSKTRTGNKPRLYLNLSDESDSDDGDAVYSDDDDISESESGSPLKRFLCAWALEEYLAVFEKQEIDLDTLMLLTESDLKSLNLPLGPFRKLTFAIQERRNALTNPGPMQDSRL